jgi:NAD(P)H-hydrate epimerase
MIHFYTETGIKVPAVTADQMREIDRIAMEETGPNLFQMMENAGRNLAALALELLGVQWNQKKIVVLAGTGGNGGGGICAARHLANREMDVELCLAKPDRLGAVPQFQFKIYQNTPGKTIGPKQLKQKKYDLIIDSLIGYSLKGTPTGETLQLIQWANQAGTPILSLDVPSGVDATTGEVPGKCIRAEWTMTLALPKTGLVPSKITNLFLADIGIPAGTYQRAGLNYISPFNDKSHIRLLAADNIIKQT